MRLVRSARGVDVGATLLQILGIILIGGTLFFVMPIAWGPNTRRKLAIAGLVAAWLLTVLMFAFVASQTGLVFSLERTNWPLTTAGALELLLLSSTTWEFVTHDHARIGLRARALALLLVLVGSGLWVTQQLRLDLQRQVPPQLDSSDIGQPNQGKPIPPPPWVWRTLLDFRAAYPEYNDLDDATFARRIIARYPQCRQMLEGLTEYSPAGLKTIVVHPGKWVTLPECLSK